MKHVKLNQVVTTQRTYKLKRQRHYGEVDSFNEEMTEVAPFDGEVAHVSATYGITVNLGDYNSARADCTVQLPTYVEEIGDAFEEAWKIATEEIKKQTAYIKKHNTGS